MFHSYWKAIYAHNQDIFGNDVKNITCRDWATNGSYEDGAGMGCIFLRNNSPGGSNWEVWNSTISGSEFSGTAMPIRATGTPHLLIERNTIHDTVCGDHTGGSPQSRHAGHRQKAGA